MTKITAEYLNTIFAYDPLTGVLSTKINRGQAKAGFIHRSQNTSGRIIVTIYGKTYLAHRIVWFMMTGAWPENEIDHEDTDYLNNRWSNLREATNQQNAANRNVFMRSKTGVKGVHNVGKRFKVTITFHGEQLHLGYYDTVEEGAEAYNEAAEILFEDFARAA
ncbi:HNH endonuclease [Rhizobium ruizarguesonis]|uniref:HNH endonuclease n=1 Tax=Rhizobium ruizarguesonis TaxID=2081791 RepID=UPI0013EE8A5D|nr:HNH endonuclease [Rhizobium ruizarguesonis]